MVRNLFLSIFRRKDFQRIWTAQLLSQTVSNMLTFAVILHIYNLTGSLTTISLVIIVTTIPSVIFGPFSGVLTDRVNYKKVLIYTNILRFFAALLLIPASRNTLGILEMIFIMSAISQFFAPAEMSSIPLIVEKDEIVAANSIYMATLYGTLVIGYGIAGPILGLVGVNWLFAVIAITYLISAISIRSMSDFDQKEVQKPINVNNLAKMINSVWSQTVAGLNYIRRERNISSPMLELAIGWAMLGAFIVVLPGFAEKTIGIAASMSGIVLIGPAGIGMLIASYLLNKHKDWNQDKLITLGFSICGVTLLALALYGFYASLSFALLIAIGLMIILGLCAAFVYICSLSLLQVKSEVSMRGRVFGVSTMMINLALGIPALFIGGIADLTSPAITLILVALVIIIYSTSLLFDEE